MFYGRRPNWIFEAKRAVKNIQTQKNSSARSFEILVASYYRGYLSGGQNNFPEGQCPPCLP